MASKQEFFFVDTNIFLRLLVDDSSAQHRKAKNIFLTASESKTKLTTSSLVFFEIYWVLKSFYRKDKDEVVEILKDILRMDFVKFENKKILLRAILYFEENNLELEDCYNIFYALENNFRKVFSFDKKFRKSFSSLL